MALHAAPREDSERRVAEALVAAEAGEIPSWQALDEEAFGLLRVDAGQLVALVPVAFLRLTTHLAVHPRPAIREDAARYAALLLPVAWTEAMKLLEWLSNDLYPGVRRVARLALDVERARSHHRA